MDEEDYKTLFKWLGFYILGWLIIGVISVAFFHVSFIKVLLGGFGILVAVAIVLGCQWAMNNRQ